GLLVARLPRSTDLSVGRPWLELADQVCRAVAEQRPMTPMTAAVIGVRIGAWGPLPFVATLLGYVVLAADVVRMDEAGLRLQVPGPWAAAVEQRRFHTARGGRPTYLWTARPAWLPE